MVLTGEAKKLKIIVGINDTVYQRPLYEAIVFAAKKYKMAGVTVIKGDISYGANSLSNHSNAFALNDEIPVVLELVDRKERIESFAEISIKLFNKSGSGGVIYTEDVNVLIYKRNDK